MKALLRQVPKAIAGALAGAAAAIATAAADGDLTRPELIVAAGAAIGAFGLVFGAPANAQPPNDG